jgi:opacity protein-like surface antigen
VTRILLLIAIAVLSLSIPLLLVSAARADDDISTSFDDDDDESSGFGLGGRYANVRNRDTDETSHMGGVFARLRGQYVGLEGGVDYKNSDLSNNVDLKTWPVTASVMVFPLRSIYGLAGLGWYNSTLDFPSESTFDDQTDTKLGYHFGAGVELPLDQSVRLTGDVRWQFVDYEFDQIPDTIGKVEEDNLTLNAGILFYFK